MLGLRRHSREGVQLMPTPNTYFKIAEERDRLAAALTEIRDILPLQNDEYARRVFAIAA